VTTVAARPRKAVAPRARPLARGAPRARVLLVGPEKTTGRIAATLERGLNVDIVVRSSLDEISTLLDDLTLAVMLVSPLPDVGAIWAVRQVRAKIGNARTPCFVVMPEGLSDRRARSLYGAGAAAVFEWPREALIVPEIVERSLGCGLRAPSGAGSAADRRLAGAIRARLQIDAEPGDDIRVVVSDGVATVFGEVDRLRRKMRVDTAISEVPGVRCVNSGSLTVAMSVVGSAELLRNVNAIVKRVVPREHSSIAVHVVGQTVVFAGSVDSRATMERIVEMVSNLPGVREIRNMLVIAPASENGDPRLARRLRATIGRAFPDDDVAVSVFGDIGVLVGRVDRLKTKRAVEDAVRSVGRLAHVVNKLEVR